MTTGIAVLNFGEPSEPDREAGIDYLERIFLANMEIEEDTTPEEARDRSRSLAERRVPTLIEEYEEIGGSPLNAHVERQADLLEAELADRGYDAKTYRGFQFTELFVADFDPDCYGLQQCLSRDDPDAMCLNSRRNRTSSQGE